MTPTMMEPALTDHSGRVPVPATRLRTDHLSEAFGITTTAPRFSWTPPHGTVRQAAYQLSTSNGWDTGRVDSDVHSFVPYGGPSLGSRARFNWKVRTWNVAADGTEVQSGWAEPMAVELGLLHPDDWSARWIGPAETTVPPAGERPGYALHRDFTLAAAPERARAYATAHGIYELFINGQRVGDQQLTPGSTSYHSTLQVQAFDIAPLLRSGRNTVRAVLTDGWFRGSFGFTRDADMYGTQTALLAQLEMESGGALTVIGTDESWLVSATEIVSADLMEGQRVDFRRNHGPAGHAVLREGSFATLTGPVAPPTRIVAELEPVSISRLANGNQIVDLGQNINGWVRLSRLGAAGTEVDPGARRGPGRGRRCHPGPPPPHRFQEPRPVPRCRAGGFGGVREALLVRSSSRAIPPTGSSTSPSAAWPKRCSPGTSPAAWCRPTWNGWAPSAAVTAG